MPSWRLAILGGVGLGCERFMLCIDILADMLASHRELHHDHEKSHHLMRRLPTRLLSVLFVVFILYIILQQRQAPLIIKGAIASQLP